MSEFIKFRASEERQERYKARAALEGKTLSEWIIDLCDEDCVDTKRLDAVSTAEGFKSDVYTKISKQAPDDLVMKPRSEGISMSMSEMRAHKLARMQKAKK